MNRASDVSSTLFEGIEVIPSGANRVYIEKRIEEYIKIYGYDPFYVATGVIEERRSKIESLWKIYHGNQDRDFLGQYKRDFSSRMWEMYVGVLLLNNGFQIDSKDKSNLDFLVNESFYVECVLPHNADSESKSDYAVAPVADGESHTSPVDEVLARITCSITAKFDKYMKKVKNMEVEKDYPFVIAINDSFRPIGKINGYPNIYSLMFGLGGISVTYPGGMIKTRESDTIPKGKDNETQITIGYFTDDKYKELSAIVFSSKDIINTPDDIGSDCFLIRNPYAINPLGKNELSFFTELTKESTPDDMYIF